MKSIRKQVQKALRQDIKDGLLPIKGKPKDYKVLKVISLEADCGGYTVIEVALAYKGVALDHYSHIEYYGTLEF